MAKSLGPDISFLDESLNLASSDKYHLSIQVSLDGFSFCILDTSKNKIIGLVSYSFQNTGHEQFNEHVDYILLVNEILKRDFQEIRIIFESQKFTFIPEPLFEERNADLYLNFNNNLSEDESVMTDKLRNLEAYNIYAVNDSLKEEILRYFPHAKTNHFLSSLIECLLLKFKNIELKNTLFTYVRASHFDVVHIQNNKLTFCNSFNYRSKEDLVYFLMFVFDQLSLNPENVTLTLLGEIRKESISYEFLYRYIRNIEFIERNDQFDWSYHFDNLPGHSFYNLINASLCVS